MKNILVAGATGQIGLELTLELRKCYGDDYVVAGYIPSAMPQGELRAPGSSVIIDVTDCQSIEVVARQFKIGTVYNLTASLSIVAESRLAMAWEIDIDGLWNVLEVACERGRAVLTPSSIGPFEEDIPRAKTPQDTIQRPCTTHGVTRATTELLDDYYYTKHEVNTRAVRFPGIISNVTPSRGGTADYVVDIFYSVMKDEKFVCPVKAGTFMDMMYMPDAINTAISPMEIAPTCLKHRNTFNIAPMSFDLEMIYVTIKKHVPDFEMAYQIDPLKQVITNNWPDSLDDSYTCEEWDWMPQFDLDSMIIDMLEKLRAKLNK